MFAIRWLLQFDQPKLSPEKEEDSKFSWAVAMSWFTRRGFSAFASSTSTCAAPPGLWQHRCEALWRPPPMVVLTDNTGTLALTSPIWRKPNITWANLAKFNIPMWAPHGSAPSRPVHWDQHSIYAAAPAARHDGLSPWPYRSTSQETQPAGFSTLCVALAWEPAILGALHVPVSASATFFFLCSFWHKEPILKVRWGRPNCRDAALKILGHAWLRKRGILGRW